MNVSNRRIKKGEIEWGAHSGVRDLAARATLAPFLGWLSLAFIGKSRPASLALVRKLAANSQLRAPQSWNEIQPFVSSSF